MSTKPQNKMEMHMTVLKKSHGDGSQVFVTCISHFCFFSSKQKGHVNRSRGQIYGQIAGLASFPQWQDLTVASLAKLSCYWCLISLAQGSERNSPSLGSCPPSPLSLFIFSSLLPLYPSITSLFFVCATFLLF